MTVGMDLRVYRCSAVVFFLLVLVLIGGPASRAQTIDPHALYEHRCSGCHAPHAGDFAHGSLDSRGDKIVGRDTGQDLRSMLTRGHGKLSAGEIDVMVAHLVSIVETGGLYREKCLICHRRAVVLARSELVLRNGKVFGRYSNRDIGAFLENHGRLNGPEIATVVGMLKGQLPPQTAD